MNKATRANKHNDRGRLVRYLGRDETRVITEATDGAMRRYRGILFEVKGSGVVVF